MFKLCITGDLGFEVWKDIPGYEGLYQASTYGSIKERIKKTLTNHPIFSKGVIQKSLDGKVISVFPSLKEANRKTGIDASTISKCCRGVFNQSGGYLWEYT